VGTVLERLARRSVDAKFLGRRTSLDAERVAKAAPAILAFEFFVHDPAWMGFQRDRARLIDGDLRVTGKFLPSIGRRRASGR
jgi:hypothetical protein